MEVRLAHMSWDEVKRCIGEGRMVIVPTGATEAHGAHMPIDTDTHQADHMSVELARRVGAVVAPALPYAVSRTFEHFAGTISLSIPTYQEVLYEVCGALVRQGFRHVFIMNGNRPNATSNDAVARRLIDDLDRQWDFMVTVSNYWDPGAEAIHALRNSEVGGMGHGCEFETSFQLATRPHLVKMKHLDGVYAPLVGWDLVAPMAPNRTYARRPDPGTNHASIFGNPHVACARSGEAFIAAALDALEDMVDNIQVAYEERTRGRKRA